MKPEDRGVLYNFARALRANGQAAESDAVMRQLTGQVKSSAGASEQLLQIRQLNDEGVVLEKSGQVAAAIDKKYRAALKIDPLLGPIRRNLGLALCGLRRGEEGIVSRSIKPHRQDADRRKRIALTGMVIRSHRPDCGD